MTASCDACDASIESTVFAQASPAWMRCSEYGAPEPTRLEAPVRNGVRSIA